jgi:hypothetical protein
MKIIFLDHDGVICLDNNWGSRRKKQNKWDGMKLSMDRKGIPVEYRFDNFDWKAVSVLNEILDETDAEIVVSSDWKHWATVEEMGEYYEMQGIKKKPIDFTKNLGQCSFQDKKSFQWSYTYDLEQSRYVEITQYLMDHPEITHWVAVDDLHMGKHVENSKYGEFDRDDWGLTNFVWTPRCSEGIKQSGVKDKILKYLI